MRLHPWFWLTAAWVVAMAGTGSRADEKSDLAPMQKEKAKANWKRAFGDDGMEQQETPNLLIVAAVSFKEKQLKDLGASLETELDMVRKALHIEAKDDPWAGKITVYLMDDRSKFNTFMRVIAKQRPESDVLGVYRVRGQYPFIAAGPPVEKYDPSVEMQAGMQLASGILTKFGAGNVPDWLVEGFGRASVWHSTPAAHVKERGMARTYVIRKGRTAKDVWSGALKVTEANLVRASLADYLAYGPLTDQFPRLLEGFYPKEGTLTPKSEDEALKNISVNWEDLSKGWQRWAFAGR